MILEGIRNLFKRRFTQKKPSVADGYRGRHVYYPEKCESHGLCIRYCPSNAIKFRKDRKIKININKCIFCGQCEDVCPTRAIKLSKFYKMSTEDRLEIYGEDK